MLEAAAAAPAGCVTGCLQQLMGCRLSVCRLARSDPGTAPPSVAAADAFAACSSPAGLANLTDGNYLFAGALTCLPARLLFQLGRHVLPDTPLLLHL